MIPIVTHYGGFESYGKLPYTTLKPGHATNDFDDIFEKCKLHYSANRKQDKIGLFENYNRLKPIYE